ncbi:unnamed protein product [Pleuronectes platessa]|uniref:Uncharacterized protein n=1 Tax=Pleuronectes platessa TaxID=8262 RepID=A0A9N7YLG2_PLEPL|nr:unnamed protein product [Pleuronectes platessa]
MFHCTSELSPQITSHPNYMVDGIPVSASKILLVKNVSGELRRLLLLQLRHWELWRWLLLHLRALEHLYRGDWKEHGGETRVAPAMHELERRMPGPPLPKQEWCPPALEVAAPKQRLEVSAC